MLTTMIAKLRGETIVPLTTKGKNMMSAMNKTYGKKAKPIFYATVRKKKLKGMEKKKKK